MIESKKFHENSAFLAEVILFKTNPSESFPERAPIELAL